MYRARQVSLNRTVAFKMMLDSHLVSPVVLERFRIEAEAAAKLYHPNIVPIYDIGDEDDYHFLVVEYVEGVSLSYYVPSPPQTVVNLGKQIASAREAEGRSLRASNEGFFEGKGAGLP